MSVTVEKVVTPLRELGALNVANVEKLAGIVLESLEEVVNAGVDSLKLAVAVKDLEAAKGYLAGQTETTKKVIENNVARGKSVNEIAQAYPASVKKIVDDALAIG